jgi:hypothetical protein
LRRQPAPLRPPASSEPPPRAATRVWLLLGLPLFFTAVWLLPSFQTPFYVATGTERDLFAFLQTVPKDALVAGDPCLLDGVPLFAGRMVLSSCEEPGQLPVVVDMMLAYYAEDKNEVAAFCSWYNVDYLVVNNQAFAEDRLAEGRFFFEPYNSHLQPVLAGRKDFILQHISPEQRLFQKNNVYVVARQPELWALP